MLRRLALLITHYPFESDRSILPRPTRDRNDKCSAWGNLNSCKSAPSSFTSVKVPSSLIAVQRTFSILTTGASIVSSGPNDYSYTFPVKISCAMRMMSYLRWCKVRTLLLLTSPNLREQPRPVLYHPTTGRSRGTLWCQHQRFA